VAPYRVGDAGAHGPLAVTPLDLGPGVAAFTVATEGALDLVLLRDPGAPTAFALPGERAVTTDGALVVVSLEGPPLALLARGGNLAVDGVVRASGGVSDRVVSED
jgi:hypothetical protein